MITAKDFCDIISNKIATDMWKSMVRNNFPSHIAEQLCDAIDRKDRVDKFNRIMQEYNEWLTLQQRQKQYLQQFLMQHFK